MTKKVYKPRNGSWPYLTIEYLYEHGESKSADIRSDIGMDEWYSHSVYPDRSSYEFWFLITTLVNRGIVIRTKRGHYALKPSKMKR